MSVHFRFNMRFDMLRYKEKRVVFFFRQRVRNSCISTPLLQPSEQSSLNYFASAWCAVENMLLAATAEGLGCVFHIPVAREADEIKALVGSPEGYEMTCLLTVGYPAENGGVAELRFCMISRPECGRVPLARF